jgi:CP family cyanate transporter-like MFS transporter
VTRTFKKAAASRILLAVAIFLVSMNLRPAITAVGPVLEFIRADTGLSAVFAGALTAMPLLAFALASPLAAPLGIRFGMERAIFISLLLLALGILLRSAPSVAALYAGSALLAAAIAIGNVLVPGLIKRDFPDKVGTMTSLYATTLATSASISSAIAVPLAGVLPGGWRGSLGVWFVPALVTVVLLLPQLRRTTKPAPQPGAAVVQNVWRSKLAWNVTLFMGLQSMSFYVTLSWLASILLDQGYSPVKAGYIVALFPALGIPIGFIFPAVLARFADQRRLAVFFSAAMCAGYIGMIVSPQWIVLWVVIAGLALGFCFPLALAFFALRAHDTKQAAALSGMAQSVGYGIAAAGPVIFGGLHDLTRGWIVPLWMLVVAALAQGWVGWHAGRKAHVGAEA